MYHSSFEKLWKFVYIFVYNFLLDKKYCLNSVARYEYKED